MILVATMRKKEVERRLSEVVQGRFALGEPIGLDEEGPDFVRPLT